MVWEQYGCQSVLRSSLGFAQGPDMAVGWTGELEESSSHPALESGCSELGRKCKMRLSHREKTGRNQHLTEEHSQGGQGKRVGREASLSSGEGFRKGRNTGQPGSDSCADGGPASGWQPAAPSAALVKEALGQGSPFRSPAQGLGGSERIQKQVLGSFSFLGVSTGVTVFTQQKLRVEKLSAEGGKPAVSWSINTFFQWWAWSDCYKPCGERRSSVADFRNGAMQQQQQNQEELPLRGAHSVLDSQCAKCLIYPSRCICYGKDNNTIKKFTTCFFFHLAKETIALYQHSISTSHLNVCTIFCTWTQSFVQPRP